LVVLTDRSSADAIAPTYVSSWGSYSGETSGLAADSRGFLYVPDTDRHRVDKYDGDGHFVLSIGSRGTEPGQFMSPFSVAVNSRDEVLVLDLATSMIQVFDGSGLYLRDYSPSGAVGYIRTRIALDPADNVYIVEGICSDQPPYRCSCRVQRFSPSGSHLLDLDLESCSIDFIGFLHSDGHGALYGGTGDGRFVKFSEAGDCLGRIAGAGRDPGLFLHGPGAIGFLGDGTLVCADPGNHRVQMLTPAGDFLASWDTAGPEGQFKEPTGVLIVGSNVYITDRMRIHNFSFVTTAVRASSWGRLKLLYR
jgi:DNA-binding beta-propeller fold protein YncE